MDISTFKIAKQTARRELSSQKQNDQKSDTAIKYCTDVSS